MDDGNYQNYHLKELIQNCAEGGVIDLSEQKLVDRDVPIVIEEALVRKQCKELWLQKNFITPDGVELITGALASCSNLEVLYMRDNQLSDEGVRYLAEAMSADNSVLTALGLGGNQITDKGVQYLADMLKVNKRLKVLYLRHNNISDVGMGLLADSLINYNRRLRELYLSSNQFITDLSADYIANMVQHSFLKRLWLQNVNFSEEKRLELFRLKGEKGTFDLSL